MCAQVHLPPQAGRLPGRTHPRRVTGACSLKGTKNQAWLTRAAIQTRTSRCPEKTGRQNSISYSITGQQVLRMEAGVCKGHATD